MASSGYVFNLCFHGVGKPERPLERDEAQYWVDPNQFEEMLGLVPRYPYIRVTFDDGNASDFSHALPALLRNNLTATFFVVAGRIDQRGYLSSDDIRELVRAGMTIGSHGLAHRGWRALDDHALQSEIAASTMISDIAGVPVRDVACPFGSYDRRVLTALRRHGVSRVYTVDGGHAKPSAWLQTRYAIRSHDTPVKLQRMARPERRASQSYATRRVKTLIKRWR